MKLVNLDFKAPFSGLFLKLDFLIDGLSQLQSGSFLFRLTCGDTAAPSSIYYNDLPHTACLRLLKEMVQTKTISPSFIHLTDTVHSTNGLFAVNGLKKPLFYFFEFLSQMERGIVEIGSEYIVAKSKEKYSILAFNESLSNKLTIDFNLIGIDNCKLTQQKLVSANSCVAFWCQLNFISNLSEKDKQFIDRMSMPQVSFQILTKAACHQYTCSLDPQDIAFITLEYI